MPVVSGQIIRNECSFPVHVAHPDPRRNDDVEPLEIRAVIDTGATASAICEEHAKALQLPVVGRVNAHTANGVVQADVVAAMLVIVFPDRALRKLVELSVVPVAKDQILFGMDAVSGTVFVVDGMTGRWELQFHFQSDDA